MRAVKVFVFVFMVFAFLTTPVKAEDVLKKTCEESTVSTSPFCSNVTSESTNNRVLGPQGIITRATQLIVFLTGAISLIMVIIGGAKYLFSGGDSNALKSAKETILYALVGLVVAIFAQTLVSFVLSKL